MSVCVLGSINLDIVCRVAELPLPGETIFALALNEHAGGKGANQAIASARWGAETQLIGAVGEDNAGDTLLSEIMASGVSVNAVDRRSDAPSGRGYINVSNAGENAIVVVGGANRLVDAAQIARADLSRARVFLAQLETPFDAIEALFTSREAVAGHRILNAAPAVMAAKSLFAMADILVVNETELARYAGIETAASDDAARQLITRQGQRVVVTLGAAGARVVGVRTSHVVHGRPAAVVDTTGAGDCFCGVMAAALSEGASLEVAVWLANTAAAISTEQAGAAVPPDLRELTGHRA